MAIQAQVLPLRVCKLIEAVHPAMQQRGGSASAPLYSRAGLLMLRCVVAKPLQRADAGAPRRVKDQHAPRPPGPCHDHAPAPVLHPGSEWYTCDTLGC